EPKVHEYKFHLSKIELAPDGFKRLVSAVNGQYPGPPIKVHRGDRLKVHIDNCLGEETAIHFHGIFQYNTPFHDGVVAQTQKAIPDKCTYTYDFKIDHQSQYMDGVLGPLIVYDEHDKKIYGYDNDMIVLVTDWYHDHAAKLFKWYLSPDSKGEEPIPNNALINGKNSYNCDWAPKGSKCECNIIEVEGTKTKPYCVNQLPVNVAQRYSVIVEANQPCSNYWMRIKFQKWEQHYKLALDNKAIISYEGSSHEYPTTSCWTDKVEKYLEFYLKPLVPSVPPKWDKILVFEVDFKKDSKGFTRSYVNGSTYIADEKYPTLQKVYDGVKEFARCENIYQLHKKGEIIDVVFINDGKFEHWFKDLNTCDPVQRDTSTLPKKGFCVDNPGIWSVHCHIEWHLGAGLLVQFVELPEKIKELKAPKSWWDLAHK
ncbi:5533_t:CDS:2, partial [Diversispora eburnea]